MKIGDFLVFCYTRLDDRHRATGRTRHYVNGSLAPAIAGLAIAQYPGDSEFYLLYCDANWQPITDTCHSTLAAAQHQAEFEFAGVSGSWIATGAAGKSVPPPRPS